jgi:hypothetical protein
MNVMNMSSEAIRQAGNVEYIKAFGSSPASNFIELRIGYAEEAKRLYMEASKKATNTGRQMDWLSAMKNLGVTCMKLATLLVDNPIRSREFILYQFREALSYLSDALYHGRTIKPLIWLNEIINNVNDCCGSALILIVTEQTLSYGKRCSELSNLIGDKSKHHLVVATISLYVANEVIKTAIKADEKQEWTKAMSLVVEAESPLLQCSIALSKLPEDSAMYADISERWDDLSHSRLCYHARAESANLRAIADDMFQVVFYENEGSHDDDNDDDDDGYVGSDIDDNDGSCDDVDSDDNDYDEIMICCRY